MESILRGIVASDHKETFKEQLLKKICSTMGKVDEVENILKLYMEWILFSESQTYIQIGHSQIANLARYNLATFQLLINANFIIDIFTNPIHTNKSEIPVLLSGLFDILAQKDLSKVDCQDCQIDRGLINVAKSHLLRFFREQGVHLDVAANISKLYTAHSFLLPSPADCHLLSRYVVKLLAGFPTPDPVTKQFLTSADELSKVLPLLWDNCQSRDETIQDCLRNFYTTIAFADSSPRASCALLSFLERTPRLKLEGCVRIIVDEKAKDNEAETVQVLRTMISWTCSRQSGLLSECLFRIMKKLHKLNKNSVLIEVTHLTIEKLLDSLLVPELQSSVEPLFFYLLLGFQHSEAAAFFKIVQRLPDTLSKLSTLGSNDPSCAERSKKISEGLIECVYFFSDLFPDYFKIFEPVLNHVENIGGKPPDQNRINDLKSCGWLAEVEKVESLRLGPSSSGSSSSFILSGHHQPAKTLIQCRSETGMVGLVNLGNTCYCNSIIQALYMTRQFFDCVMSAPTSPCQNVLHHLQQSFAFLRHSMRSIYSPAEFVKASRPPWFEPGRQQDCSEFLRYLLDTLHEQEKRSKGLSGLSATPRDHRIKRRENEDENPNGVDPETGSVKPSCSTTALDAISEAPEDEDMISQGSGTQMEEIFGSRSSLGVENAASDSEDENILGSRGSLNGLKRWTTEENLCTDSTNSVVEFSVLPIHDSHSNSTDSGIQSVGDSIRGSSDSMSNGPSNGTSAVEAESTQEVQVTTTTTADPPKPANPQSSNPLISIEQQVFGGKIETKYECCQCHTVSIHTEFFNDLLLPFPAEVKTESIEEAAAKKGLTMQDMLNGYLKPEKLEGDNKYHCEKCNSLQEAVKTIDILESPNHLKCTLMRFEYDRTKGTKRKILTDINYELSLILPYGDVGQAKDEELYSLYAIVVHSGVSSDSGHYYTYAREPKLFEDSIQTDSLEDIRRSYDQDSSWYIFNDSMVSYTTFESFVNMKNRFHSDTAYVLFYQRFRPPGQPNQTSRIPLRNDLQTSVERDNIKFMREKERSSSSSLFGASTSSTSGQKWPPSKKDDDSDGEDGGSTSGRHCGGSDFNTPGRFVC